MTYFQRLNKIILYGIAIVFIFIGGFLAWAMLAPLESAAIAPGKVVVAGNHRIIQHLEGGIVEKIYVRNGSEVKKSQLLIELLEIKPKSEVVINQKKVCLLTAIKSRILAEAENKKNITFPPKLLNDKSSETKSILKLQRDIFFSNNKAHTDMTDIYKQRIEQLETEIESKKSQLQSIKKQHELINTELSNVKILAKKKLIKQSRLLSLQREAVKLSGEEGRLSGDIARLQQKIGETQLEIISLNNERRKQLLRRLREIHSELGEAQEKLKFSEDTLNRTDIRSPIDGIVVDMKVHTIGGVIQPGEQLMDIVPANDLLIIKAKLSPLDIDTVRKGLQAKVSLTGLSQRNTPKLIGQVSHISADTMYDEKTGHYFYEVTIDIPSKEMNKLEIKNLSPGMPAEVMIIVKKATPWEYFTKPIIQSFNRAFREQ